MHTGRTGEEITIRMNIEEYRLLFMTVYAAVQFVHPNDYAAVTGRTLDDGQTLLDLLDVDISDRPNPGR